MQEKEVATNFVLLCQSRNMVGHFKKAYMHISVKNLHFLTPARIQILAFSTRNHLQAEYFVRDFMLFLFVL